MNAGKEDRLLQRLLATFKQEARERITAMAEGISQLRGSPAGTRTALVESLFREAHSLKAAAQSVGQKEISALCQSIESVFAAAKRAEIDPSGPIVTELQLAIDAMEDFLVSIEAKPNPQLQARGLELARNLGALLE